MPDERTTPDTSPVATDHTRGEDGVDRLRESAVGLSAQDTSAIAGFIRRRNTAVLTVMFTDIQGFTRITEERGEVYSRDLRQAHDGILKTAIEEDGAGLVIKFIGDAVMAVFSEPSAAVDASLRIQAELRDYNTAHPELEDLHVRIGLHMGQVAVEDALQPDVFGRHVNRAARIESLAAGGQIFMSDAVFDSARGWLGSREHLSWTCHGRYHVKGIDKPVEIHEVCDARVGSPQAPRGARRTRNVPRLAVAVGLVAAGALAATAMLLYQETQVWLLPPYPSDLRLNDGERVVLEGGVEASSRRLTPALPAGRHVLRFDVARGVRHYAELEVERGENRLAPRWQESRLPAIAVRAGVRDAPTGEASRSRPFEFLWFDGNGERHTARGELSVSVRSRRDAADPGVAHHVFGWRITRDGELLEEGERSARHRIDEPTERVRPVTLRLQPPIGWFYSYYMAKEFAEFTLGAAFTEYLKPAK
jgi:class 3 adenylate cyclase